MHLLYCDWNKRDSTLVTNDSLVQDMFRNENAMRQSGIKREDLRTFFIPPYEWWNDELSSWFDSSGMYKLFSFTPGTTSNADYTYSEMGASYLRIYAIVASIKKFTEHRAGN